MNFSDYIPAKNIIPDLKGNTKIDIIKELLHHMQALGMVSEFDNVLNEILQRENHLSTGLENGVAIPHSKTDGISQLSIVFGIKRQGVDFDSYDAQPAFFIFLVLSPKNTSGPHIQALAMISRNLKNREIRESLKKATSAQDIARIFTSFE